MARIGQVATPATPRRASIGQCHGMTPSAENDVTSAPAHVTALGGHAVTEPDRIAPVWIGQTVNLADLPEFCQRHGLAVCGVDVPRGVMTFALERQSGNVTP